MKLWTMQIYPDTDILKQFIKSSKYIFLKKDRPNEVWRIRSHFSTLDFFSLLIVFFKYIASIHSCKSQTILLTLFLSDGK